MERKLNYFRIIHKYLPPHTLAYHVYIIHVTLVTQKALRIARKLGLSEEQKRFIEEASMLHDIGICRVKAMKIGCNGELPYIQHITEGRKILEAEGLPLHARIAENHIGMGGLSKEEIVKKELLLPARDMLCETLEERIISYADLFYSKNPARLFEEKTIKQVKAKVDKLGKRQEKLFEKLVKEFE